MLTPSKVLFVNYHALHQSASSFKSGFALHGTQDISSKGTLLNRKLIDVQCSGISNHELTHCRFHIMVRTTLSVQELLEYDMFRSFVHQNKRPILRMHRKFNSRKTLRSWLNIISQPMPLAWAYCFPMIVFDDNHLFHVCPLKTNSIIQAHLHRQRFRNFLSDVLTRTGLYIGLSNQNHILLRIIMAAPFSRILARCSVVLHSR